MKNNIKIFIPGWNLDELHHCMKSVLIRSLFWSVFLRIRTKCGDLRRKSAYSVWMQENTDRKKLRIWTFLMQCTSYILRRATELCDTLFQHRKHIFIIS